MGAAREAETAERTRPGQLRRMRGRDFLKAGGVEELWPEGVWVGTFDRPQEELNTASNVQSMQAKT